MNTGKEGKTDIFARFLLFFALYDERSLVKCSSNRPFDEQIFGRVDRPDRKAESYAQSANEIERARPQLW